MNEKPLEKKCNKSLLAQHGLKRLKTYLPSRRRVRSKSGRAQFQNHEKKPKIDQPGDPSKQRCATLTAEAITTELGRLDNFQRLFAMIKYVFRSVRSLN